MRVDSGRSARLNGGGAPTRAAARCSAVPPPAYYGNVNPELLAWIPLDARRVLELGCGEGALAAAYKARNPLCRYTAVELHGPAAAVARTRVDRLIEGDVMALDPAVLADLGPFDAVVMGDVLEHLADPWAVLRRLETLMAPEGVLAISVPNAAHWSLLAAVMDGDWPAADSGLFDRTHLRWFTLTSLRATLAEAGLDMARARPRQFLLDAAKAEACIPVLADAAERMGVERRGFEARARTLQWVAAARRAIAPPLQPLHLHFAAITPDFLDVRMKLPAEALGSDASLTLSYVQKSAALPDLPADRPKVAIVQRLALPEPVVVRRYVEEATRRGWLLVYEIDDHPDLIGAVQRTRVGEQLASTLMGFAAVQTSTARLGRELAAYNPEVAVFSNAVLDLPPLPPPGPSERVRVFHGALNREGFTRRVAERLGGTAARHPEVEFVVVHDRAFFEALPAARKVFHPAVDYGRYLQLMGECDVVLSPLEGSAHEAFKSDVKFLEAARAGAAFLASAAVYADTVVDGRTGLIAPGLDDWPSRLNELLSDAGLRRGLAARARAYVAAERMMAAQVAPRRDWYRRLWSAREVLSRAAFARMDAAASVV